MMIKGYVVYIHDSVNYDIDLDLSEEMVAQYWNVISNKYTYYTTPEAALVQRPDASEQTKQVGVAYRCRIKGISALYRKYNNKPRLVHVAHQEVSRRIDRQNGWVLCQVGEVDIYRRLLVDLYDPITKENLNSILLQPKYSTVYRPYQDTTKIQILRRDVL